MYVGTCREGMPEVLGMGFYLCKFFLVQSAGWGKTWMELRITEMKRSVYEVLEYQTST